MKFRTWLEATVKFKDITEAIKKTLEFVVTDGEWKFEPRPYGLSGIKTVTVAGHFYCTKGHFFLTANAVDERPIDSYDSMTGEIDGNSKVEIIGNITVMMGKNSWGGYNLKKVGERSNTSGGRLHTPHELAIWVKKVIDDWQKDDDGDDENAPKPEPTYWDEKPSGSRLVTV
ncbi:MAG: hypothetical protein M0R80_08875 [Proteobacteria bacterium]|jgi:hypothetical protein|nr:hypothetical protein [Pseudomonadota bacterium]